MIDRYKEVLERDIKNATGATQVAVTFFPDDEMTVAVVDGKAYLCIAGSDDDTTEEQMSKIITIGAAVVAASLTVGSASALDKLSRDKIAALPQDKLEAIKRYCAKYTNGGFNLQLICEDGEYMALKTLIERGSVKPNGDKL
jgi:hypothetical protein